MVDKLEAGKKYKLIDKSSWYASFHDNKNRYNDHFINDEVVLDRVDSEGDGWLGIFNIIGKHEYSYFTLAAGFESLQTINSPFGELDKQTKKDLLCAWVDGSEIEMQGSDLSRWSYVRNPSWFGCYVYRVKPTISAKDTAKAKLISEAQQQLRDAQEALDKAQQL